MVWDFQPFALVLIKYKRRHHIKEIDFSSQAEKESFLAHRQGQLDRISKLDIFPDNPVTYDKLRAVAAPSLGTDLTAIETPYLENMRRHILAKLVPEVKKLEGELYAKP